MADRYWVGGTATWDATAGTKWATTSGGAGGAAVPTSADDVYFDSASGAVTVTISGTRTCANFVTTGFTGTITGASSPVLQISGTVITLGAASAFNLFTGLLPTISAAVAVSLTTNGVTLPALQQTTAGSTLTCQDALNLRGVLTVSAGTFDANDFPVIASGLSSPGATTRVINMGNALWRLKGNAGNSIWDVSSSNLTINFEGSSIQFENSWGQGTIVADRKFDAPVTIPATTANYAFIFSGVVSFANLTVTGQNCISINNNCVIDNGAFNGTPEGQILFQSGSPANPKTVTVSGALTGSWVTAQYLTKAGAGSIVFSPGFGPIGVTGFTLQPNLPVAQYGMGI